MWTILAVGQTKQFLQMRGLIFDCILYPTLSVLSKYIPILLKNGNFNFYTWIYMPLSVLCTILPDNRNSNWACNGRFISTKTFRVYVHNRTSLPAHEKFTPSPLLHNRQNSCFVLLMLRLKFVYLVSGFKLCLVVFGLRTENQDRKSNLLECTNTFTVHLLYVLTADISSTLYTTTVNFTVLFNIGWR